MIINSSERVFYFIVKINIGTKYNIILMFAIIQLLNNENVNKHFKLSFIGLTCIRTLSGEYCQTTSI